jgi:hypothetical protein
VVLVVTGQAVVLGYVLAIGDGLWVCSPTTLPSWSGVFVVDVEVLYWGFRSFGGGLSVAL